MRLEKSHATWDHHPDHHMNRHDDHPDHLSDVSWDREVPSHGHHARGLRASACQDRHDEYAEGSMDGHPICGFCNYLSSREVQSQTSLDNRSNNPIHDHTIANGTSARSSVSTTIPGGKTGHLPDRERHRYPYPE